MNIKPLATAAVGVLVAAAPFAAFAETSVGATVHANIETRQENRAAAKATITTQHEDNAKSRADQEIQRRIKNLNELTARINGAKRIGDGDKSSLSATLSAQIAELTTLDAKIQGETSTSTLKDDVQSITKSYRIYLLVIPQSAITAAADRIMTVAAQMDDLSAKLKTRLDTLAAGGTDVSASVTLLADLNAKNADAKVQAQAAVAEVSGLKPDNGDTTVQASNKAALEDAHKKIQAAQQDLKTAREDARKIMVNVKGKGKSGTASSTPI